ncbi:flagellar hook-associated protein FlgL [Clostridium senegalense]|uniref:flagellar hook-associated protein FlgL n=1 Tax=Clostridium senegalense TaxID=1465809 RepID=UPI001C108EB3|nr:flagellar hook-associated protein FlgL [Clostridium senegalense]MBU5225397.1 flagellar hook-associated protein FlgL [Clostridium senegalense]
MRITNKMMSNSFLADMNVNLNHMKRKQEQLDTGKEFKRPSDSPFKAARSMQIYSEIYANEQYNTNINHTINWLDTTDSALDNLGKSLSRIRELMVSAGNGTYDKDELKAVKDEISEKVNEISQILNTSFDGKYIFGGTHGDKKPTTVDENGELIAGTIGDNLKVEISSGVVIEYSVNANEFLNFKNQTLKDKDNNAVKLDANGNTLRVNDYSYLIDGSGKEIEYNGGFISVSNDGKLTDKDGKSLKVDKDTGKLLKEDGTEAGIIIDNKITTTKTFSDDTLSGLLKDIIKDLGEDGDISKVNNGDLERLDSAISNLLSVRSKVGTFQNRMKGAKNVNEDQNINLKAILSYNEDIDWVEKSMEMGMIQTVYLASLQTASKILPPSLLDFIR